MSLYIVLTVSYIIGMLLATIKGHSFISLFLICFVSTSLFVKLISKSGTLRLVTSIFLLFGFVRASVAMYPAADNLYPYINRFCEISGIVSTVPDEHTEYCSYILTTKNIKCRNESFDIDTRIRITSEFTPNTGSEITVRGFIKEHSAADNSTEFDLGLYYLSQNICYKLHAEGTEISKQRAFLLSPSFASEYFKSRIKKAVDRYFYSDEAAVIKSILLGIKSEFTPELKKTMIKTSAMRFLYPSFLHMYLILSICQFLGVFSVRRKKEWLIPMFLFLYAIFNSTFYTFVRAAFMYSAILIYKRLRGFSHYPDIAAAVILIMLIANPLLLFNGGFVTSSLFGIMIYLFNPFIIKKLKFIKSQVITNSLSMTIVGSVCLLPVNSYLFGGISLYTFIFSLLITPLTLMVLILSPITLLLHEIFGASFIFGPLLKTVLSLIIAIPKIIELLPYHYIFLPKPGLTGIVISILLVAICRMMIINNRNTTFKVCVTALILVTLSKGIYHLADIGNMYLYFVNVGQGDGAVINVKGKDVILIDGGGSSDFEEDYNIGEEVFLPYLTAKGYTKIDLAIVSHFHKDHCEGIIAAIENLDVEYCLMPDTLPDNVFRKKIIETSEKHGTKILYGESGDTLKFTSGMTADIIAPVKNHSPKDENDTSLVVKFNYNDTSLLFGGDITSETEKLISGKTGNVDILKASHHGSATSSTKEFIDETSPEYVVFSVGKNNMYNHPNKFVTDRFTQSGSKLFRTDEMGDICFKCTKDGKIKTDWFKENCNGS